MHPRTTATLEKLKNAEWFAQVGNNDTEAALVLPGWQDAIQSCNSIEWGNLCLEACNQYRQRLRERSPFRYNEWNDIISRLKIITTPFVARKITSTVARHNLPKVFEDTVQWDILNLCMESEYADVYQPGFYASQAYWYIKGHFPCGWEGVFPEGRLIVY